MKNRLLKSIASLFVVILISACTSTNPNISDNTGSETDENGQSPFATSNVYVPERNEDDLSEGIQNAEEDSEEDLNTPENSSDTKKEYLHPYNADIVYGNQIVTYEDDPIITEKYLEYLYNNADSFLEGFEDRYDYSDVRFYFFDLDGDYMNEMAYAFDNYHSAGVYIATYDKTKDEVINLGSFGSNGNVTVYEGQNILFSEYIGMGYINDYFYTFDENKTSQLIMNFESNEGAVENEEDIVLRINGEPVSEEIYEQYLQEWKEYYSDNWLYLYYDIMIPLDGNVDFDYYYYPETEDNDVCMEAIESYANELAEFGFPKFCVIDLNGDNIPELVFADDNGNEYITYYNTVQNECITRYATSNDLYYLPGRGIYAFEWSSQITYYYYYNHSIMNTFIRDEEKDLYYACDMFVYKDIYDLYKKAWDEADFVRVDRNDMISGYDESEITDLILKMSDGIM